MTLGPRKSVNWCRLGVNCLERKNVPFDSKMEERTLDRSPKRPATRHTEVRLEFSRKQRPLVFFFFLVSPCVANRSRATRATRAMMYLFALCCGRLMYWLTTAKIQKTWLLPIVDFRNRNNLTTRGIEKGKGGRYKYLLPETFTYGDRETQLPQAASQKSATSLASHSGLNAGYGPVPIARGPGLGTCY